ncbi:unnamed protein product [Polarella glacialis]|uniref:Uncharacterized protein n=1 Tax=Polarella glacialis TaxID=89957 RepID=A0A813J183_POLGL|nr:unnamed protein product [Polarella glacialis]
MLASMLLSEESSLVEGLVNEVLTSGKPLTGIQKEIIEHLCRRDAARTSEAPRQCSLQGKQKMMQEELTAYLTAIQPPSSVMPEQRAPTPDLENYIAQNLEFFENLQSSYALLKAQISAVEAEVENDKSNRLRCRTQAGTLYQETLKTAHSNAEGRWADRDALVKVQCYLAMLLDGSTTQEKMKACNDNAAGHTFSLDIVEPRVPDINRQLLDGLGAPGSQVQCTAAPATATIMQATAMAGFSSLVGLVCVAAAITAEDPWTCVNDNITTDEKLRKKIEPACAGNDLDVTYQSCTAPCCGCWKAYWPELLDLWGWCGVPASTFKGEGTVGSYKAKEDWYCGNGVWGTCVVPKWDAAQAQFTECTSGPDQSKLKEPFGLYRNRRSEAESCACLAQAYRALDSILRECQVPSWLWFKGYSQRRFTDNHCGSLDSGEAAFNVTKKWSFLGDFTSNSVVKGRKQEAFVGILPVAFADAITAEDPWTCVNDNITTDEKLRKKIEPACAGNDLDVTYQSCTAPCCGCWKAYWPELLDLWGRCSVPASTFKGEGTVGSYKAKEDWYCGNGVWGTCVVPKWDAAQAQLTECTSGPDQSKLKEPFGLYRNRRSGAESCACLSQAYRALDSILRECQVPSWLWFKGYSQRRFTDNHCGSLDSGEAAFNVTKKWSFLGDFTSNSVVKGRKQEAFVGILPVALAAAITAEDPWTCVNDNIATDEKLRKKIEPACAGNDLDVTYQSCTAPCCGCWKAYWPELLDLWGRCGVPASTFKGEGAVGSYKAKEDWYCGNGVWGTCVVPKWDAAQAQLTECTSGPDQSKLKEPFGVYRNRRSEAESCACLAQAYRALDSILRECQVPSWLWFKGYSQRRFTDNHCGSLDSGEAAFNVTKKWSFLRDFTSNSVVKGRKQEAFVGILPVALAAGAVMMIGASVLVWSWREQMLPSYRNSWGPLVWGGGSLGGSGSEKEKDGRSLTDTIPWASIAKMGPELFRGTHGARWVWGTLVGGGIEKEKDGRSLADTIPWISIAKAGLRRGRDGSNKENRGNLYGHHHPRRSQPPKGQLRHQGVSAEYSEGRCNQGPVAMVNLISDLYYSPLGAFITLEWQRGFAQFQSARWFERHGTSGRNLISNAWLWHAPPAGMPLRFPNLCVQFSIDFNLYNAGSANAQTTLGDVAEPSLRDNLIRSQFHRFSSTVAMMSSRSIMGLTGLTLLFTASAAGVVQPDSCEGDCKGARRPPQPFEFISDPSALSSLNGLAPFSGTFTP